MVTFKPAFGNTDNFAYSNYNPSDEEMDIFLTKIEKITSQKTNENFRKTTWQLITLIRYQVDSYNHAPNDNNTLAELDKVEKVMNEAFQLFSHPEGISDRTHRYYTYELMKRNLSDDLDPLANMYHLSNLVLDITKSVRESVDKNKESQKSNQLGTPNNMRQIAAEELARALDDDLNIKPSKTRNGIFDSCFKEMLNACKCSVNGRSIIFPPPNDTFHIIKSAIDSYPNKPKCSFLEIELFPGLSG